MMLRQLDQLAIDALFPPHEMALELDVDAVASKSFE